MQSPLEMGYLWVYDFGIFCDSITLSDFFWDFSSRIFWKSQFTVKFKDKTSWKTNIPTQTIQLEY